MQAVKSAWDFSVAPRIEPLPIRIRVEFAEHTIADSTRALIVLQPSQPPVYYIPQNDFLRGILLRSDHRSHCEWKGEATYWSIDLNNRFAPNALWSYDAPAPGFEDLRGFLAFNPSLIDAYSLGDERITPLK